MISDRRNLVARTTPLPGPPPDLIAEAGETGLLWMEPGGGLAATGVALRLELPRGLGDEASVRQAISTLRTIESHDEVGLPGCGPVAIGALPFDPGVPTHLVVPVRLVGFTGDQAWMTTVEPSSRDSVPEMAAGSPPDQFTLVSSMSHADWQATVGGAIDAIKRGELRKVVLARRVDITANRPFVVSDVLSRLQALYPSCMIFRVGSFLGASPELLVRKVGLDVESQPLAGTVARSGDARSDDLLASSLMASAKARHEHQVVVDALGAALGRVCSHLEVPNGPSVVALRNVSHLATRISGRLAEPDEPDRLPSALELAALIHPTPAVCGDPTGPALRFLKEAEGFDRGSYAGPVGWMDARGDGAFAVGIRCAEVMGSRASIYAGNGVVAGSDPAEELAETQLKFQALLAALVRP